MLSRRLLKIAEKVSRGKVVFDVGSDHALLPSFLVMEGICPKVYAGDNKEGPLSRAKETVRKLSLEGKVIPILSDGLDKAPDDVEIVTISGMGFFTVEAILDKADISRYEYIVCQVNRNVEDLRKYISDHRYSIIDEDIVYDDFYYEIVVFNTKPGVELNREELAFGPVNLVKNKEMLNEYIGFRIEKLKKINVGGKYDDLLRELEDVRANLI